MPIQFRVKMKGVDPNRVYSVDLPRDLPPFVKSMVKTNKAMIKAKLNGRAADVYDGTALVGSIQFVDISGELD